MEEVDHNIITDDEWNNLSDRELTLRKFWSNVYKWGDKCWLWAGKFDKRGEPIFYYKKESAAYRVSYMLHVGPIPKNCDIHHKCKNHLCIRPDHLEPLTREEHMDLHNPISKSLRDKLRKLREIEESKPAYLRFSTIASLSSCNYGNLGGVRYLSPTCNTARWQKCPICGGFPEELEWTYWE